MDDKPVVLVSILLTAIVFSAAAAVERGDAVLEEEFVANSFTPYAHAPTIVETRKSGRLVVAWFGGSREGVNDVSIWVNHKDRDSSTWSPPQELDDGSGQPCWNAILVEPSGGPLLAYYRIGDSVPDWQGYVKTSKDEGVTWSGRSALPESSAEVHTHTHGRFLGPTKNRPLELPDGSLLCGSSTEEPRWTVHMELAGPGDYVNKFEFLGQLSGADAIQPAFLVLSDDYTQLQTICRHHTPGAVAPPLTARSYDMGRTWEPLRNLNLNGVSPSGLDAITITNLNNNRNRWHILAYAKGDDQQRLAVAVSRDGENWDEVLSELEYIGEDSEMEYPSLIQDRDGLVHLVLAWGHSAKIKHLVLDPWVLTGEKRPQSTDLNDDGVVNFLDFAMVADGML